MVPSITSIAARAATVAALVVVCGCQSPPLPTPPPARDHDTTTVALDGCATPSVEARRDSPWPEGPDPLHSSGPAFVMTAELCFAIRALQTWADAALIGEPYLRPGDGGRIKSFTRIQTPIPPPLKPGEVSNPAGFLSLSADIPGRPYPVVMELDRSVWRVSFGLVCLTDSDRLLLQIGDRWPSPSGEG